jgi:NAD(P)-dependent dehydrogenase (short-subunit alcohol dehydrogenase family)
MGGTRGIGQAIADGLAQAGASVAVSARRPPDGPTNGAAALVFEAADLANDDPESLLDRVEARLMGPIEIVVHAAGIQRRGSAVEFVRADWDDVLQVNLSAPFRLSQALARRQIGAITSGRHVFVASLASRLGLTEMVAYGAAKSGLLGVVRALSTEWASKGITVNAVAPGYVRTELTEALFSDDARREALLARIPMGRFGAPEDIAGPVVFLSSNAASYVTGQLIMVDGGWTAS